MAETILVLNAGSSSLKFSAFLCEGEGLRLLLRGQFAGLESQARFVVRDAAGVLVAERSWDGGTGLGHPGALRFLLEWGRGAGLGVAQWAAAGHRVVHGGVEFSRPARLDLQVLARLELLVPLAPLHQPHNLSAIRILSGLAPSLPQVACFDTAFHRTQPPLAQAFALPRRLADEGVRRYGFHGLSYEYIDSVFRRRDPVAAAGRVVVAHLGNGASLCALRAGRSVATTMGFTPLDGLPMGTRCGALDPGVVLYLMRRHGLDGEALEELLFHQAGLLGVSGISSDVRELLASPLPEAAEALDLFCYRIGRELGSLAAALGGLDALVFTGGIGENAAPIRARVCRDAAWLGLQLDEAANAAGSSRISQAESRVSAWVLPTDEELIIARHTREVLGL